MRTIIPISTEKAESVFIKSIKRKQTYFLNGTWGSGKTSFLKKVEKKIKEKDFSDSPITKVVTLDLWNIKDERSVIKIAFSKLHPFLYYLSRISIVTCLVVSILLTPVVNLGIENSLKSLGWWFNDIWYIALGLVALFVALWQLVKFKSEVFYTYILKRSFSSSLLKNKLLIIDDFDRVSAERQIDSYKLFNILKGRITIVFVGDYNTIALNENTYLQKIIDKRMELPYDLHPNKIWFNYFEKLEEEIQCDIPLQLKEVAVLEKRNLREQEHFNSYINQELFDNKKIGHVQLGQQLTIIYIYLFHQKLYTKLLHELDRKDLVSQEYKKFLIEREKIESSKSLNFSDSSSREKEHTFTKTVEDILCYDLLQKNDEYPECFDLNREGYFLYESVNNLDISEANEIVSNKKQLKSTFLSSDIHSDFYKFIRSNFKKFDELLKNNLLDTTVLFLKENKVVPLMQLVLDEYSEYKPVQQKVLLDIAMRMFKEDKENILARKIITHKQHQIMPPRQWTGNNMFTLPPEQSDKTGTEIEEITYNSWDEIIYEYDFDISLKLYFYEINHIFNFYELGKHFSSLSLSPDDISNLKRKDSYLLTYLSSKNLWGKFDKWESNIWATISSLTLKQFLTFWIEQGIIESDPYKQDNYTVWTKKYEFEPPHSPVKGISTTIVLIKKKTSEFEKEGITLNYEEQEDRWSDYR